jgi:hypothetical protein
MRWLEFLGILPKGDHAALRLQESEHWILTPTKDGAAFFRALAALAPPGSLLYLEGSTEKYVPRLLEPLQVSNPSQVGIGTIMPPSDLYHVPATADVLLPLAEVVERHGIAIPAIHVVVYRDNQVLLSWYDAFTDDPICLSSMLVEEQVRAFADSLGLTYSWGRHAA